MAPVYSFFILLFATSSFEIADNDPVAYGFVNKVSSPECSFEKKLGCERLSTV